MALQRPEVAQTLLEEWAKNNRGDIISDQPTKVTPQEFGIIHSLFRDVKQLGEKGGLPFAIMTVEIEESKSDMRTGAARVRVSMPNLTSREGRFDNLQAEQNLDFSE